MDRACSVHGGQQKCIKVMVLLGKDSKTEAT